MKLRHIRLTCRCWRRTLEREPWILYILQGVEETARWTIVPYCRIQNLVEKRIAGRQAASRYLKQLVQIGVLEEKAIGREKLFIHPKLMKLLTREGNSFQGYKTA